jgi:hypothetical protein
MIHDMHVMHVSQAPCFSNFAQHTCDCYAIPSDLQHMDGTPLRLWWAEPAYICPNQMTFSYYFHASVEAKL